LLLLGQQQISNACKPCLHSVLPVPPTVHKLSR
jgi:hypothetical protein